MSIDQFKSSYFTRLFGEVPEWSNGPHSKCGRLARVSRVQIPASPQVLCKGFLIMKKNLKNLGIILLIIVFFYPAVLFSQISWHGVGIPVSIFFNKLERLTKDYQYTFQALAVPGSVLVFVATWWRWKIREKQSLMRMLSSISVSVNSDAVAEIKNTSSVDGAEVIVRVYRPYNFEEAEKNKEFLKYVAGNKEEYLMKRELLIKRRLVNWEKDSILNAKLAIGESVNFHLKNIQEEKRFIHFAPIKIGISLDVNNAQEVKQKYMLFRFAHLGLRENSDDFLKNRVHPYGKWSLVYSESETEKQNPQSFLDF